MQVSTPFCIGFLILDSDRFEPKVLIGALALDLGLTDNNNIKTKVSKRENDGYGKKL